MRNTVNVLTSYTPQFVTAGENFVVGVNNAMVSRAPELYKNANTIGQNTVKSMNAVLGNSSPELS